MAILPHCESPPNTITLPPNGRSQEQKSRIERSMHSAACLCVPDHPLTDRVLVRPP